MKKHKLRITDKKSTSFKMTVWTVKTRSRLLTGAIEGGIDLIGATNFGHDWLSRVGLGEWETIDKGFIRFQSGSVRSRLSHNGDRTTRDLIMLGESGVKVYDGKGFFGMQLFEYEDIFGVNRQGEGFVIQPWVINLEPGRIGWKVLD